MNVGQRPAGELLALLVGDDLALGPHHPKQRQRQGARPCARLQHATPRIDVSPEQDHGQVLRVDHLGAAGHLEDVLGQRGTEGQVPHAERRPHPAPVRVADDGVVGDPAAVRVEGLAFSQGEEVALPPLVDEENLLAVLEGFEDAHRAIRRKL